MLIGNRYELQGELGRGGMGTVYKGRDTHTQQTVAIKHLKSELTTSELIERFKREGEALRELNHPNIVKMLDAIEEGGNHYLIIEYLAGGDLSALLKQGTLSIEKILQFAIDICDALTRAHRLNIIHRDLKPANVLIGADGTPRLTDFGVAHLGHKERVTPTAVIIGTVDYLAPEVLDGETIDSRTDIWAFGIMLFEMLTGQRPFIGETLIHIFHAIATQPVPDLEAFRPDIPIAVTDLIYRMLEKDSHARIQSVRQVGLELENILYGRSTHMPPETRFAADTPTFILRPKHNLPAQTTPFVGRETELAELTKMLNDPNIRLITIVAQGGMGKTRLALELAANYVDGRKTPLPVNRESLSKGFKDGVYFVELAPLSDSDNIASAIATATSYQFQADERDQKQQILDFLGNKHLLLVLDNYEHLLEGAALVTDILKAAPDVKILATSRQRLNQLSETIFNLQGMDFPAWETPADALEYAAVKLFMHSAKRAKPDFELTADNMDAVARMCKLVQGMPLGIVMAAAWLAVLPPDEIAAEIAQSIDFLASDMGEIPERQRSMRAVFDYSWNLMTEAEQQVFMKLSVFRGGFTRRAGQAITGANLQQLMSLVNKSLIQRDNDSGRYEIHELLRQYAAEKAEQVGQTETVADAHMNYYADAMHERESHLIGHRQLEALTDISSDLENVRAAWLWAVEHGYYEIVDRMQGSLRHYCFLRTRQQDGLVLFEVAVQRLSNVQDTAYKSVYGRLLTAMGEMYHWSSQVEQAHLFAEKGVEIARKQGNVVDIALALLGLSFAVRTAQPQHASTLAEESRALFREGDYKIGEAWVLHQLGYLAANRGQYEYADQLWLEALNIFRDCGDKARLSGILTNLGVTQQRVVRRFDRAEAYYRESLAIQRELHLPAHIRNTLANLANLFANQGRLDEAETATSEALLIAQEVNYRHGIINGLLGMVDIKNSQEKYETALELADEALSLIRPDDEPRVSGNVQWARGMVLCTKGDYVAAEKVFRVALRDIALGAQIFHLVDYVFGFSVVLAFQHQQYERALALASLVAHHPTSSLWDVDPLPKRLIAHLQQQLPADVYAAVWEHGKSLDLDAVIQELLKEFGQAEDK